MILKIDGPVPKAFADCERILRSVPKWFGVESALMEYAADSERYPTFVARADGEVVAFLTTRKHSPQCWEVHCMAVNADYHGKGIGMKLHAHVEAWLCEKGVRFLQVKTLATSHLSGEYALTRRFYARVGYCELEVFPQMWGPKLPVLQLIKQVAESNEPPRSWRSAFKAFFPIAAVMVHVSNVEDAIDWYQKALPRALLKTSDSPHFEFLEVDGVRVEIVPADEKVTSGAQGTVVYWNVRDFPKSLQHFESLGAIVYRGPIEIEDGMMMCQVKDPWGNLIGLRGPVQSGEEAT